MDAVKNEIQVPSTAEVMRLTTKQSEGYQYLLALVPKEEKEYKTTGVSKKLVARFGTSGLVLFTTLKKKGLISPGAETGNGRGGAREKEFTIFRREFETYDRVEYRAHEEKPARKPRHEKPLQASAPSQQVEPMDIDASFRAIAKHVKRLLDGGYEVEIRDGKLSLNRKL